MDHDLSPLWTLFNIVKAIKAGLFVLPPPPCTTEGKRTYLIVNNKLTLQEQLWVLEPGEGAQLVHIPSARAENQEVTVMIKEHKLFFDLQIIVLMFSCES